ncbi:MAG: NAD(P)H-hydrate epimerase, partial [Betaproteobacteria bacterium]|nr:NAD(P)H-hydrate epimerase [Betaproteobacteria bacterium]
MKKLNWQEPLALFDIAQTRQLESLASARIQHGPSLMDQAGLAVAKLAMAIQPFAPCYWIFCGPGNNGGDGLEAATHLKKWGRQVRVVLWQADLQRPTDAAKALHKAQALGISIQADLPSEVGSQDLCIDAMLGIGLRTPASTDSEAQMQSWIESIYKFGADVLAVDVPSGLNANTGQFQNNSNAPHIQARHT